MAKNMVWLWNPIRRLMKMIGACGMRIWRSFA